jgi:CRP/FNR family transcriptional regulator, cyclic AMP receptor protein
MALTTEQKLDWLGRVDLFRGCSPESLLRVAHATGEVDFPADHLIVNQGQIGNGLYILVGGAARVVRGSDTIARLGAGDFFGELAVIDQLPRMASVIAETPCTCLALAAWDLLSILESDPQLARNLLHELALRVRTAAGEHHQH